MHVKNRLLCTSEIYALDCARKSSRSRILLDFEQLPASIGRFPTSQRAHTRLFGCRKYRVGGPNQVVSASGRPIWVRSPTQATYPSGRTNTAVGAGTAPST